MIAEAKFLRAFQYFELVKNFGGVPVILEMKLPEQILGITRKSTEETYAQIEQDLKDAINDLPKRSEYSSVDLGRATKGAAMGYLGKIYLYQGKFAEAEKIITEAENNGFKNELLVKEKHYSLLHQNKTSEAGDYLKNNFSNFKNKNYLSESIINQTLFYYNSKDLQNAEKWIANYRKEIGTDQYIKHIESIENNIKQQKVQ